MSRTPPLLHQGSEPNAWDRFVTTHQPGDVVHGKIARFANPEPLLSLMRI
jgi:hypothetical protein